mmetsp:Transcript_34129/g.98268  ORF Transcript_34129/g.98268 Transcript_34129/m.98268 type:complete len:369 (+) Transcript_34129:146-1252(+)
MIWDASDANPMHRRIPAEVVSRRTRAPPKKPAPQKKEEENEDVTVDLKAAIMLKPEARPRWLTKACKMVTDGRASSTELYNIIVSRKFASGLPDRVGRRLVSIVEDSLDLFSDKQQRYLSSSDCPLMAHLRRVEEADAPEPEAAADGDREMDAADAALAMLGDPVARAGATQRREREERERQQAEEGAAKWQAAQDEAALRRQVADAKAHARREAARREEKQRQQDAEEEAAKRQAAAEEAARRRKLEEEADDIFAKALVPQQPPPRAASNQRGRSRSVSAQPRSGGSRSISSRTARRRARSGRKNRRPDWQSQGGGSSLTGSRALLMNRDYVEDLPHLPRPSSGGPPVAPARFGSRSRSRSRGRFRR